jgi:MHS family proline/betaine transporter-like MFS transporter
LHRRRQAATDRQSPLLTDTERQAQQAVAAATAATDTTDRPRSDKAHDSFQANNDSNSNHTIDDDNIDQADGLMRLAERTASGVASQDSVASTVDAPGTGEHDIWETIAGVAGNILEWYDFAVFGFFSDIIGSVFFPHNQGGNASTVEAFAVFGGAFLMRPIGGMMLGYIGDVYGRKKALVISIFLMAFPTFAMGCLPTYDQVGGVAIVLLIIVRLLQGLSVGGQLVSSLVFTLENHHPSQWGLYGSYVMAAANLGTLFGALVGSLLRSILTLEQLETWGWRLPFLSGIVVSFSGFYLRNHGEEHGHGGPPSGHVAANADANVEDHSGEGQDAPVVTATPAPVNPIRLAFSKSNRRALIASAMVPMLWSAGFYLSFVWMAIYMDTLIEDPVPHAFAINSLALLISVCLFFPVAGHLSDLYGRRFIMTIGGVGVGLMSPLLVMLIGRGHPAVAIVSQCTIGIALSFWGAPMCAWLVESFDPASRLTSVAIGYNLAQATVGGLTPSLATVYVCFFIRFVHCAMDASFLPPAHSFSFLSCSPVRIVGCF